MIHPSRALAAVLLATLAFAAGAAPAPAGAPKPPRTYRLNYTIEPLPAQGVARVTIRITQDKPLVTRLNFHIKPSRHTQIKADGTLGIEGERAIWHPPATGGALTLLAQMSHKRADGKYDSLMTANWAIFRGDDIVPAAKVTQKKRAESRARLYFRLPPGWTTVDTGWPRLPDGSFGIDNPQRRFDRPIGWMIAGKVGNRRESVSGDQISIAAPIGSSFNRMDVVTFVNWIWPEADNAFGRMPSKLLIVGGEDPMFRGGLSAPNSLFLHAERPMVSGNATSPVAHELTHVVTRIRGKRNDDWIAEGIAEYYAIELLHRSGGMNQARYDKVRKWLRQWSRRVETLRVPRSDGRTTARAVLLMQEIDKEIRAKTKDERNFDHVVRALMKKGKVDVEDFRAAATRVAGGKLKALDTPLLR